jgi:DNA polymerase I
MNSWDIRVIAGSYSTEGDKVVIDLFGQTQNGESVTARVRDFLPYFYLVEPPEDIVDDLKDDPEVLKVKDVELEVEGEKKQAVKVTIKFPFKVPDYRNKYKSRIIVLAADIPFIHRFYYDYNLPSCITISGEVVSKESPRARKLKDEDVETAEPAVNDYTTNLVVEVKKIQPQKPFKPTLRILSFDLENSIKDSTIYCICCVCRDSNGDLVYKEFSGAEGKMITDFAAFIREFDPDVITGYNIDNFDIPVIMQRAEKNNLTNLQVGRDLGKFYKVGSTRFWRVHGRVIADAWWNAKMELRPNKETLNYLSQMLFNEKKGDVDPSKMDDEWAANPKKVIEYCTRDAELALRILEKIAVVDKAMDLATVAKLPLDDAFSSGNSTLIDSILIREADKNAIGVPCTHRVAKTSKIEGGYVHTFKSGLYNFVSVLDFRAMYPSIIIANNICFTTLNSGGAIKSPTGVRFLAPDQRKGLLPKILEEFMEDRDAAKQKMKSAKDPDEKRYYDGLQAAIKILMNSVYGVFASAFYRFTDPKIGASITAFARKNIKDIIAKLEQDKYTVIYSDTDSIFVETGKTDLDDAVKVGQTIAARFTKAGRVLEFEGIFNPLFSHGKKKRYVGKKVYPKEELVIRGYETQRSDAFELQKEVLKHMFELILSGKNDELVNYAREVIGDLKIGNIPPDKLVISKSVRAENQYKDPNKMSNVIAMRKLKEWGYEVVSGMKVSYIVTDGQKVPKEVEPTIEGRPLEKQPDWKYYTERMATTIYRITEGLIPDHELNYEGLITAPQQKSLFSDSFSHSTPKKSKKKVADLVAGFGTGSEEEAQKTTTASEQESKDVIPDIEPENNVMKTSGTTGRPKGRKKKGRKGKDDEKSGSKLEDFL